MSGKEAAAVLARKWGLCDVAPADLRELAKGGLVRVTLPGHWPLYDLEGFTAIEELRQVGEARRAWWAVSINRWDAAEMLGLSTAEFDALAAGRRLQSGRFDRYRRAEVMALRQQERRPRSPGDADAGEGGRPATPLTNRSHARRMK
jgi:hypothetical protein